MKKLLVLSLIMLGFIGNAQIQFGLYTDKIILGDGDLNGFGTIDLKATMDWRSELSGYDFALKTQYEHAELYGGYFRRFTVGLGMYIPIDRFEIGGFANIGTIKRKGVETPLTYSILSEVNYYLTDKLSLSAQIEYVYRSDLDVLWSDNVWKLNGLIGIKYTFKDNWNTIN